MSRRSPPVRFGGRQPDNRGLLVIVGFALLFLAISGCSTLDYSLAPPPTTTQTPVVPALTQVLPTSTPLVTQAGAQAIIVPQVTPVQGKAYIQRPYGFIEYVSIPSDIAVEETHIEQDTSGNRFIGGTAKNKALTRADFVQITFNVYNSAGAQVGNSVASIYYLRAGYEWKFRAEPAVPADYQYNEIAEIFVG